METKTTSIARINGVDIVMIENGEKRIAVRPICDILGIADEPQIRKLKSDPKYSSTTTLVVSVGADGKQREMVTIPFKKVFGWLYSINANNVKEEARESLIRYQEECNDALFNYFAVNEAYMKRREEKVTDTFEKQEAARYNFSQAKNLLDQAKDELKQALHYTKQDYLAETSQMELDFNEGTEATHAS